MIDYVGMAKEVAKALEKDNKLFSEFVSNYSEVSLLDENIRRGIAGKIDEVEYEDYFYRFFNSNYSFDAIYNLDLNDCYIDDVNIKNYSVYLARDDEGIDWLPVIFIKEFWDFYFDYISKKKENEKMVCSLKLREGLKQNEEQNEANIDDICKTIAEDFVKNYGNYTDMFSALNCFSNVSENDCVEFFTNFLKRLF